MTSISDEQFRLLEVKYSSRFCHSDNLTVIVNNGILRALTHKDKGQAPGLYDPLSARERL